MKKSRYIYIVLVLLLMVTGYLVLRDRNGGSGWSAEDFGIQDTARIELISIESGNQKVVLTREDFTWQVNGEFPAGREKIRGLLILLSRVKITGSVQQATNDEIRKALESSGIRIIIADNRKVVRSFIAYHDSVYSDYTYMRHENEDVIYRVEVPGLKYRNLAVLFRPDPVFWKDTTLFQYRPQDIRYIHCYYPEEPELSFRLAYDGNASPEILTYGDSSRLDNIDEEMVWRYMSYFSLVAVDEYLPDPDFSSPDEFRSDIPDVQIRVVHETEGSIEINSYTAYYYDEEGMVQRNLDDVYLLINGTDWARMKYINLDPLIKQTDYFITD